MQVNILLVEDDIRLGRLIRSELENQQYQVQLAYDGIVAGRMFQMEDYDLVLLDINVPYVNGFELCQIFRKKNPDIPIIMLTALGELEDKMQAFTAGADDYLVKPFNIKELIARIRVFIKRRKSNDEYKDVVEVGDLVINVLEKQVTRAGIPINLTAKEFKLLELLVRNKGKVFSKAELAEKVWEQPYATNTNTIEVYINFLRNKIDKPFPEKMIHTKSGFGYYIKQP
jgi:two-component system copper resistance phosphate regulon response regulator CusR